MREQIHTAPPHTPESHARSTSRVPCRLVGSTTALVDRVCTAVLEHSGRQPAPRLPHRETQVGGHDHQEAQAPRLVGQRKGSVGLGTSARWLTRGRRLTRWACKGRQQRYAWARARVPVVCRSSARAPPPPIDALRMVVSSHRRTTHQCQRTADQRRRCGDDEALRPIGGREGPGLGAASPGAERAQDRPPARPASGLGEPLRGKRGWDPPETTSTSRALPLPGRARGDLARDRRRRLGPRDRSQASALPHDDRP